MKQLVILFILAFFANCLCVHAQTIVYTYDESGNCTKQAPASSQGGLKSAITGDADNEDVVAKPNDFDVILMTEGNSIKVYPNPTDGQFQVELNGYEDDLSKGVISLYSSQGRLVVKLSKLQQLNSMNLSNQANGTYVLKINIGGKAFTHKIVLDK